MPREDLITLRQGTAAAWTAADPVLAEGEPGAETDTGKVKVGDGATAWTGLPYTGGAAARESTVYTTATLAPGEAEVGTVPLGPGSRALILETSAPARVQAYASAAQRTADASRGPTTDPDPTTNHGVLLEVLTTDAVLAFDLTPAAVVYTADGTPDLPIRVTNSGAAPAAVVVTITYQRTE